MPSDIVLALQYVYLNNYLSLAGLAAIMYDYGLTFSTEIEYIWCRPWTWVSTMFLVVRYVGLFWIMTATLLGSSFIPGPAEVGRGLFLAKNWAFTMFISAANLLMILRVYAMWHRSKPLLYILLLVYVIQIIIAVVLFGIYDHPHLLVTTVRILDFSSCAALLSNNPLVHRVSFVASRLGLSATLAILAIFQSLKQSFETYKAMKQWQPNRYMGLLAREGILYFVMSLLYETYTLLTQTGNPKVTSNPVYIFIDAFISISFYTIIPRFVTSIRKLYDQDARRGGHIDTGFGVQSWLAAPDIALSTIEFGERKQVFEETGDRDTLGDIEPGDTGRGSGLKENSRRSK